MKFIPSIFLILSVWPAAFMAGYVYRDNTIMRTLTVQIAWQPLEVTKADEKARKVTP